MKQNGPTPTPVAIRVLRRTLVGDGCWIFTGVIDMHGYGVVSVGSKTDRTNRAAKAHRALYEALYGPVPRSLDLDHLCRVRACVNPGHLEPVTRRENLMRGEALSAINARKTHCTNGHPFDVANTWVDPKTGWRVCRACGADRKRLRRAQKSGAA